MSKPADQNLQHFNGFIAQLEGGALHDELSEKVRKCVQEIAEACHERGGVHRAALTLTIEFKMDQKDGFVEIQAAITEKLPKAPRGRAGIFFADAHGNLTRENPRQLSMLDEVQRRREERETA